MMTVMVVIGLPLEALRFYDPGENDFVPYAGITRDSLRERTVEYLEQTTEHGWATALEKARSGFREPGGHKRLQELRGLLDQLSGAGVALEEVRDVMITASRETLIPG